MLRAQTDGFTPVCVDSVWYDSINPNIINVSVYNGGAVDLIYPSVQIVDPNGDTISNENNYVMFFAQLTNTYTVYTDTISVTGITDFSGYTFVMNENFGSSSFAIGFCIVNSVQVNSINEISYSPNPVSDNLLINSHGLEDISFNIYDGNGQLMKEGVISDVEQSLDFSSFASGIYLIRLTYREKTTVGRIIKL